jgi:hypothetical protein
MRRCGARGGGVLALLCRRCMRLAQLECRVCRRRFKDLPAHFARSECGRFDREGMWWQADRPPTARQVFP